MDPTVETNDAPVVTITTPFWNEESVELNDQRLKKQIPPIPSVSRDFQVVHGGGIETLAYLMLQVVKTEDTAVTIRAIASAVSWLLEDKSNYTGSPTRSVRLTGLEAAGDPTTAPDTILTTNFQDAEDVTVQELLDLMSGDSDEIGSWFGVMFIAGNKRVTQLNRSAFNERRTSAVTASLVGDPIIFVPESEYLTDELLKRVYATFLKYSPVRAYMTDRIVSRLDHPYMSEALAFINMFLLLIDSGMSAIRIIKEAVLKHRWILSDFEELKPELAAANTAQEILKKAPGKTRSFLKAIHGNNFVPVNYSQIDNLLGVCKEVLKRTTPSYQNYAGGRITDGQLSKINAKLGTGEVLVSTAAAE